MHGEQILPPLPLSGAPAGQISTCSAISTERILPPPPGGRLPLDESCPPGGERLPLDESCRTRGGATPTGRILPHSGGATPAGRFLPHSMAVVARILPPWKASAGQPPARLATSTGRIPPYPSASARRILPCSMAPARQILPRDSSRCENLATFCGERFDGHSRQPPCGAGCSSLCAKT